MTRLFRHYIGQFVRFFITFKYRCFGIKIGEKTFISSGAWLDERRGILIIGDHVHITNGVKLLSHDAVEHILYPGRTGEKTTVIKDGAFIGMGSIILGGVTVGENSIVGAGSVVTCDVPDYTLVSGNPAKILKRFNVESSVWERFEG